MASLTVTATQVFPAGTTVGAYPKSGWSQAALPPSGAPVPAASASAAMGNSSVTLTGLADDTGYYLGGQVSGVWRYVSARTPAAPVDAFADGSVTNAKVSATAAIAQSKIVMTGILGVCVHGANASVARPSGFDQVLWVGSVEPTNMINGDIWVNTAP